MPIPIKLLAEFSEDSYYHVICKCIDDKKLFYNDDNRYYFLNRYNDFLNDFLDTYAYILMDNHVHWLVKTKKENNVISALNADITTLTTTHKKFLTGDCSFHELLEQQFNRFFISYVLALNKSRNTKGHLFSRPFKRIAMSDDFHITQLIVYIHANTQKHNLPGDFRKYKWSSYNAVLSQSKTHIKREEVLEWFGGKGKFIEIHEAWADQYYSFE